MLIFSTLQMRKDESDREVLAQGYLDEDGSPHANPVCRTPGQTLMNSSWSAFPLLLLVNCRVMVPPTTGTNFSASVTLTWIFKALDPMPDM